MAASSASSYPWIWSCLLNIASLPAFRIVEARAEPFDAMVGLAQTGQMPTDATQRCVYDIAATTPIKCGRGLPPIAVDQLAPRLADTPQSGASPLPQGLGDDLAHE